MTKQEIIDDLTKDSNGYFWGVFHDKIKNNTPVFFIADKELNILMQTEAFYGGNFTKEVKKTLEKYGINPQKSRMRTDANIEKLKESIQRKFDIHILAQKNSN